MTPNQFSRSGTVRPTEKVICSQEMANYLVDKVISLGETCHFDMLHNGGDEYAVHEFCGALGGVSLRYLDARVHTQCIAHALKSGSDTQRIYTKELRDSTYIDKYNLRDSFSFYDRVVFLPGSNMLKVNIDMDKLESAVADGAVIKPHPITNSRDIAWLSNAFGKENILGAKIKGAELMRHCKRAYMAKNTELWFLAITFGCGVTDIGNGYGGDTYRQVIDVITKNHVHPQISAVNRIFGSSYSGIYFSKEDIDNNVEKYIDLSRTLK